MARIKTLQDLFKRYRRPGDLVFAVIFMMFALFLLINLDGQTTWVKRTKLVAQPAFWPMVSVWLMALFAALHLLGSVVSPRIPATIVFTVLLAIRLGYRTPKSMGAAAAAGFLIVVLFKSFLQVKVPGGKIYEVLPEGLRAFMLTYF